MAEVQVYGGTGAIKGLGLLSYRKPTKQTSTAHGGVSGRAVDGNANGNWGRHSVTHTSGAKGKNDWQVDLGAVHPVYMVIIHNRKEVPTRINGAKVYVDAQYCGSVKYIHGIHVYPISCGGKKGKVVHIKHTTVLSLAEVEVLGTGAPKVTGPIPGTGNVKLISLRRPTTLTTTYGGKAGASSKAVDGNTNGYWGGG